MSKLDDILADMKVEEYGTVPVSVTKQQIKDLVLGLYRTYHLPNDNPFEKRVEEL